MDWATVAGVIAVVGFVLYLVVEREKIREGLKEPGRFFSSILFGMMLWILPAMLAVGLVYIIAATFDVSVSDLLWFFLLILFLGGVWFAIALYIRDYDKRQGS